MSIPVPSVPPTFPQPGDSGETFNERAFDAFAYLAALQPELVAMVAALETYAAQLFRGTSTSSNTIAASGTKNFTTQTGLALQAGQYVIAARTSAPSTTWMRGQVSSYDPATGALAIVMAASLGSGTHTDWSIGLIPDPATLASYLALAGGTMTGLLATVASASGGAGLRVPHGSAPSAPTNGDIWTTTAALFARINGASKQMMPVDGELKGYKEATYTITDGAAFEIDPANGSIQKVTLGASRTPKATNMQDGQSILLAVDDGSAYSLTWSDATFGGSGVKWMDNSAPTLATSGLTWISLWKMGGQVYGSVPGAST